MSFFHIPGMAADDPDLPSISDTLLAHYRADLGVTKDGSNLVSTWADQSGNSRDLTQGTASHQPLWVDDGINGKNVIRGDGVDNRLLYTPSVVSQPWHTFVVFTPITYIAYGILVTHNDADSNPGFLNSASGSSPNIYQNAGAATGNPVSATLGTDWLIHGYWSGASSYLVLNDGSQQGATNPGTNSFSGLGVHGHATGVYGNQDIAEIAIYDTEVTSSALTTLEDYFNTRYSLW